MSNSPAGRGPRLVDRLWLRAVGVVLAGAGVAVLGHWAAQLVAPSTWSPTAVVSLIDQLGQTCYSRPRHCDPDFRSQAVLPNGTTFDLPTRWEVSVGQLIQVERSAVGGQIVGVRYPDGEADLRVETNTVAKLAIAVAVLGLGAGVGGRRWREHPALLSTLFTITALVVALAQSAPEPAASDGPRETPPDAMQGYADPPTDPAADPDQPSLRVASIVGRGVEVPGRSTAGLTVTGPALPGPPPGAGPAAGRGFDLVSVPVRATPGRESGSYGPGTDAIPNVRLLGDGVGDAVWLYGNRTCGQAPGLFADRFQAPREGYLCFAVAAGFTPRYLVLFNDEVAIDLR